MNAPLSARMRRRVAVLLLAGAAAAISCVEGPFEPWDPTRDDRPFRFLAGAADATPLLSLTPGRVPNDSTVEVDVRLRDAPLVAAVAFELVIEAGTVSLDSVMDGLFFVPGDRAVVAEFAPVPGDATRWIGVVALDSLSPGVGGSGIIGTLRVRRLSDEPFTTELRFDAATTVAYGPGGVPLTMNFAAGRFQHTPREEP